MFVQNLNERRPGALLHYADAVMRVDRRIDAAELLAMDMLRNQTTPGVKAEDVLIETNEKRVQDEFALMKQVPQFMEG